MTNAPTLIAESKFSKRQRRPRRRVYFNGGGPLTISSNTFTGNAAPFGGGAVYILNGTGARRTRRARRQHLRRRQRRAREHNPRTRRRRQRLRGPRTAGLDNRQHVRATTASPGRNRARPARGRRPARRRALRAHALPGHPGEQRLSGERHRRDRRKRQAEPRRRQARASGSPGCPCRAWATASSPTGSRSPTARRRREAPLGAIAAEGGGACRRPRRRFTGSDDLFLGNSTAAGGWGGAIYVGGPAADCVGTCPASSLTLLDSTVVANSVDPGAGSEGGAIWGSPNDSLTLENTIVGAQPATARGVRLRLDGARVRVLGRLQRERRAARARGRGEHLRGSAATGERRGDRVEPHDRRGLQRARARRCRHRPRRRAPDLRDPPGLLGAARCDGRHGGVRVPAARAGACLRARACRVPDRAARLRRSNASHSRTACGARGPRSPASRSPAGAPRWGRPSRSCSASPPPSRSPSASRPPDAASGAAASRRARATAASRAVTARSRGAC